MAQSGVLQVPRVQLKRGLARTMINANLSAVDRNRIPQVSFTAGRVRRWELKRLHPQTIAPSVATSAPAEATSAASGSPAVQSLSLNRHPWRFLPPVSSVWWHCGGHGQHQGWIETPPPRRGVTRSWQAQAALPLERLNDPNSRPIERCAGASIFESDLGGLLTRSLCFREAERPYGRRQVSGRSSWQRLFIDESTYSDYIMLAIEMRGLYLERSDGPAR